MSGILSSDLGNHYACRYVWQLVWLWIIALAVKIDSATVIDVTAFMQVRYVFENAVELASVPATSQDPKPSVEGLPQTAGTATQAASEPALQIEAVAQDVLTALYSVAEAQGREVATICRSTSTSSSHLYLHCGAWHSLGHTVKSH